MAAKKRVVKVEEPENPDAPVVTPEGEAEPAPKKRKPRAKKTAKATAGGEGPALVVSNRPPRRRRSASTWDAAIP